MSVNDYLAKRDADWMRPVYDLVGVSVGHVGQTSTTEERREAYAAEVTYAPVSEIGFDLLRDRLRGEGGGGHAGPRRAADRRGRLGADRRGQGADRAGRSIEVDEADKQMAELVAELRPGTHFEVDHDGRNVNLTTRAPAPPSRRSVTSISTTAISSTS